jgi:Tol biopolymer transport system component
MTRGVVVGVIAVLLFTAGSASGLDVPATIAFTSTRDCQQPLNGDGTPLPFSDLYLMNADGSAVRRLTSTCFESQPAWSPDGSQLAFISERDGYASLFVMNADGTGTRRVTPAGQGAAQPAWSRQGTIAFADAAGGIDTIKPDGSQLTHVTSDRGVDPSWSADGAHIAYSLYDPKAGVDLIEVVDADGRNGHQVARGVAPAYSPDGKSLAWAARDATGAALLEVAAADGSGARAVVTIPPGSARSYDLAPAWSPDSASLSYDSGPEAEIYSVPATGGVPTRLTLAAAVDTDSAWRPATPSTGLAIAKVSFRQRACATRPGIASVLVVDAQGRPLGSVSVTTTGATSTTNGDGIAALRPKVAARHRGRLVLAIRAVLAGRSAATKRVSLPACR